MANQQSSLIDPTLSLAFSMFSNKGVYALLLGSGLSRSAQIPTGWEVVMDLIRKLAALKKQDPKPDPARWYQETFGKPADYSELLNAIAHAPAERQSLLKGYFEPTEQQRRDGVKMPMPAHNAIANLVGDGIVRVIITTNFDRLIERALEAKGINPVVISTADAAHGTVPLSHLPAVVIKPNGDYLDSRIRNTASELAEYPEPMQHILKQVLDEYGLVICGWSADWDTAMRTLMEGCVNRRFTRFWATRSSLSETATKLATACQAEIIPITDADTFFTDLNEKIRTLSSLSGRHPLSATIAAETVKRYVVNPTARIQLHDLIVRETRELCTRLNQENFPQGTPFNKDMRNERCKQLEAISENLLAAFPPLVFWGDSQVINSWVTRSIQMVGTSWHTVDGHIHVEWKRVMRYPALLLTYAAGLAALARKELSSLREFLVNPIVDESEGSRPVILNVYPGSVSSHQDERTGRTRDEFLGYHIHLLLRPHFRDIIPSDHDYLSAFHLFEYILSLVVADLRNGGVYWPTWFAAGARFVKEGPSQLIDAEIARNDVPLVKAGFFDGSLERLKNIKATVDKHLAQYALETW